MTLQTCTEHLVTSDLEDRDYKYETVYTNFGPYCAELNWQPTICADISFAYTLIFEEHTHKEMRDRTENVPISTKDAMLSILLTQLL